MGLFGLGEYKYTDTKGRKWHLHKIMVTLRNSNGTYPVYYFAQKRRGDRACGMPEGYEVIESPRTGMPMLRKKRRQPAYGRTMRFA